jgi:aspartyl-tRNA(Asn)/glutamyl-tRNA(Gln) amidotransferase subunit A
MASDPRRHGDFCESVSGLLALSIAELGRKIASGTLEAEALLDASLEAIAARNPSLNAFITVCGEEARRQARDLDREREAGHYRGPLHGIPVSIKDLIDVKGLPTTAASRVRAGHIAEADAPVVAQLRQSGAVIVGKCNLHELALGTTNDESAFGPARHPLDPARSPGGSSGGSAVSVAASMCCASIGTDTGGSIRIPAAACGVVGLKPSFGEISTAGVFPLSSSLDHVGPLAQNVEDAWIVYQAIRTEAVARPAARPLAGPPSPKASARLDVARKSVVGLRLGKLTGYFLEHLDRDVRSRFEEALTRLHDSGATLIEASIPHAGEIASTYVNLVLPEAAAHHAKDLERRPEAYSPGVLARLQQGRQILMEDYTRAQRDRAVLRADVNAALSKCDALVLPTLPIPAPVIGATSVTVDSSPVGGEPLRPLMLRFTQLFNLTGHPAISLPCGNTADGLPCGFQLVGRHHETVDLLAITLACEPILNV